jgi:mannose-6-phosphate isomerase-like protein (cupin superfamily)
VEFEDASGDTAPPEDGGHTTLDGGLKQQGPAAQTIGRQSRPGASVKAMSVLVVPPDAGRSILIGKGGIGVRYLLPGDATGQSVAVIEHPLAPQALGGPPHIHRREDEYSFVLEGTVGFKIGDETVNAGPGTLVAKPRDIVHTFWNPSSVPARILEIISPAGFERYFDELSEIIPSDGSDPDLAALFGLAERYGLEIDMAGLPQIVQEHGVSLM